MPRPLRDTEPGIFHVYAHCVWASDALFRDDEDRMLFLRMLALSTARAGWTCIAYCLMRTHYHLILEVGEGVLPKGMHALNFRYASWFNVRHGMKGHVQGRRYGSRRVVDEADLRGLYKYVVRNPTKALLCEEPETWSWSSYAGTVGLRKLDSFVDPRRILSCFQDVLEMAQADLRRFVDEP